MNFSIDFRILCFFIILSFLFTGCGGGGISYFPSPSPTPQVKWTFLVYLDGTNDLESAGEDDIGEMKQVGSTEKVNIIVQQSKLSERGRAKRYYIERYGQKLIEDIGMVDMVDPYVLKSFIKWGIFKYPAEYYALVLWDHGAGWKKKKGSMRGIIYDQISGKIMSMIDLKDALNVGKRLDIVAFDACLMGMAEVAYQIKDFAKIAVFSEESIPWYGYPYNHRRISTGFKYKLFYLYL